MRNVTRRIGLVSASLLIGAALSSAATARPFTPEDLLQLRRINAVAVSPDGQRLVYALGEPDIEANTVRADLWERDLTADDARPRRLTETPDDSESSPAYSPDGERLFFLSARSGSSQLWSMPARGGEAVQISNVEADVAGFSPSPDGRRIALWFDEAPDCAAASCPDTGDADGVSPRRYDSQFARHWSSWEDGSLSRVVVYPFAGGRLGDEGTVVSRAAIGNTPTRPFGGGEQIAWHPDGQSLFFVDRTADANEPHSTDLDIYWVPASGAVEPEVLTGLNEALDDQPAPSPDGRYLAYLAMATPGYESDRQVLVLRDLTTGETRRLTEDWDRSIASIAWAPDRQSIWIVAADRLDTALFRYILAEGRIERVSGAGSIAGMLPLEDGSVIAVRSTALSPPEMYRIAPDGEMKQLTQVNADRMADIEMPTSERFTFAGADGDTVHGIVYRPPGLAADARLPVAMFVHGGPQGSFNDSWSYRWNPAAMAAQGYGVVSIDFHGSTGYGQEFTDSITGDWGGKPLRDLQLGLDAALEANPWMDGERICALGASYGGYMMNWIAGNWPGRFDCLVNHAGIFDLRSFYYTTEELWFPEHDFGGTYDAVPREYERWNPVNHVGEWRTPMMLIHGERDFRIPYVQSLGAFTALQNRQIPSELLIFPDENHWVLSPRNSLAWHRAVYAWVARWTGENVSESGEPTEQ